MAESATTPKEKVILFKEIFFPTPPKVSLGDIESVTYND
jgi:hypothetical protein